MVITQECRREVGTLAELMPDLRMVLSGLLQTKLIWILGVPPVPPTVTKSFCYHNYLDCDYVV
jgi:hypothetical protein